MFWNWKYWIHEVNNIKSNDIKRVLSLDVLRGVAIILVLLNHCDVNSLPGFSELNGFSGFVYWKLKGLGWSGVDLFFVLSGFLIGGLLFSELDKTGTIKVGRFLLRRGLKLWPSYFILLLVLGVTSTTSFVDHTTSLSFIGSISVHVFFLQNYLGLDGNGPTWSLAVEEHFYTILPFLLLASWGLGKNRYFLLLAFSMVGVVFILRVLQLNYGFHIDDFMLTHLRFDALLYGVICQYIWRYHNVSVHRILSHKKALILIVLLLISPAMFLSRANPIMFTIGFTMLSIGYGLILLLMVSEGLGKNENNVMFKLLAAVGQWSYNIYLWHFFLPSLLGGLYFSIQIWLSRLFDSAMLAFFTQAFFYILCSIFVGYLGTKIIERPFLLLREKIIKRKYSSIKQ